MRKGRIDNDSVKNEDTEKKNIVHRRRKYSSNVSDENDTNKTDIKDEVQKYDEIKRHKTILKLRRKGIKEENNVIFNQNNKDKKDEEFKFDNNEKENNKQNEKKNLNKKNGKMDNSFSIIKTVNKHSENLRKQRKERLENKIQDEKNKNVVQKRNKNKYNLKPLVITVILVFSIFIIYLFVYYAPVFGITLSKETDIEEQGKIDVIATEANMYKVYGDELLVYSNQTITTYNASAKKTWSYKLESQFTPNIYIYNKYMIVSNNSNGLVYLFNDKKEILNMKVEGIINNIFMDDSGNMAIDYSTNGQKKVIGVYNKNGKNIYNIYLSTNNLIDIKMLNNAKKLIITEANISSFTPSIVISKVDIEKSTNVEEIVKVDNNFVYNLTIESQNIIIVFDDKIASYDIETGKERVIKDFDSNQLMFLTLNRDYYSCIEKENGKYYFISKRLNNTDLGKLELENIPKLMDTDSMLTYLVYQDKVSVINKWGIDVKTINIDNTPREVLIFNNGKSAALIYTNKIYIINITL